MRNFLKTSYLAHLLAFFFVGSNLYAQETNNTSKESAFDFSVKLGVGYLAGSSTDLMYGYTPIHKGLISGSIYLGFTASKIDNATGLALRSFILSSAHSVDAFGKENTSSNMFYFVGAYNRRATPIHPINNLKFIFSTEAGYSCLRHVEQINNPTTQIWDNTSKTRHGLGLGLGFHLQYHINKTVYFIAGTDVTTSLFFKRINEYQQKDKSGFVLIDRSVGIGLNL